MDASNAGLVLIGACFDLPAGNVAAGGLARFAFGVFAGGVNVRRESIIGVLLSVPRAV